MRPDTQAIHSGRATTGWEHIPMVDFSTTYRTGSLEEATASIDVLATGGEPQGSPVYQRLHNPTVARFEDAMATLEGTSDGVAFASGMAAISALLLAAKMRGNHIVAIRPMYGGTDHLLSSGLLGVEVTWCTPENVAASIRPETSLIVCETPANPTLSLVDIEKVVEQAGSVPVAVDSTFATPVLQNPATHGATIVIHSATKYIGGHGDAMGGVLCCNEEWAQSLRQVRIATGGVLHPMCAYQLHRGLQTLPIRVRAAQESAMVIARRLQDHPGVERVYYPGIPPVQSAESILGKQMKGPGAMIAFDLKANWKGAVVMMESVRLMTPAVSLGSTDSLIQHPAGLTHRVVEASGREEGGIGPGLIRLSIGLEDLEDLWRDLDQALNKTLGLVEFLASDDPVEVTSTQEDELLVIRA